MVCVNRWTLTFPQNIRKKEYSIQFSQTHIDTNICSNYNGITAYKAACIQIANFPQCTVPHRILGMRFSQLPFKHHQLISEEYKQFANKGVIQ